MFLAFLERSKACVCECTGILHIYVRADADNAVRSGQPIAHVGLSGSTTGPHLHWGMRFRGQWLDPARILRAMADSRRRQPLASAGAPNVGSFR